MYNQIETNKSNTRILIYLFVFLITMIGYVFGMAWTGDADHAIGIMGMMGIGAVIWSIISYYAGGGITLAISGAKEVKRADNPLLYRTVENLAITAGIPTPKICIINDTALNAFATGRDPKHAVIVITSGLLNTLEKVELEGVMAHELSHIQNYDIRLQSLIVALVGIIALLSDFFLRALFYSGNSSSRRDRGGIGGKGGLIFLVLGITLAILSPIIAKIMQMGISRQREYLADASGALLTRYPEGLARALEKISADTEPLEAANKATAHLYIENPLRNEKGMKWMNKLFSTHPPVTERIARLRKMI